eukprot:TRINITY_DN4870_c0_g3_i4.p1 TRINITY_DN4870_c0_g3~~TRINITY_DN4870_c0_g3_i4.p1  ORF type:complete len:639 (+),score=142.68 TRINITY_DN4870_c0_g3_i4:155-2071(+)
MDIPRSQSVPLPELGSSGRLVDRWTRAPSPALFPRPTEIELRSWGMQTGQMSEVVDRCNRTVEQSLRKLSATPSLTRTGAQRRGKRRASLQEIADRDCAGLQCQLESIMDKVGAERERRRPASADLSPMATPRQAAPARFDAEESGGQLLYVTHNLFPLRKSNNSHEALEQRLVALRENVAERVVLSGAVTRVQKERAAGRKSNFVLENTKPRALAWSSPQERSRKRFEDRALRATLAKERRQIFSAHRRERTQMTEQSLQDKLEHAEVNKLALMSQRERERCKAQAREWGHLIGQAARHGTLCQVLLATRQKRRCQQAAMTIQRAFRRARAVWKQKKLNKGQFLAAQLINRYAAWWRKERYRRSADTVVKFLSECGAHSKFQMGMRTFFFNIRSIQRAWRRYTQWKSVIWQARVDMWVEMEEDEHQNWAKNKLRLQNMFRESTRSREELLRQTGGFDMDKPPEYVSRHIRDELLWKDLRSTIEVYVVRRAQYRHDMYGVFLPSLRKNRMIDDSRRRITGHLTPGYSKVSQMVPPVFPLMPQRPSKRHMHGLIDKGRHIVNERDRGTEMSTRRKGSSRAAARILGGSDKPAKASRSVRWSEDLSLSQDMSAMRAGDGGRTPYEMLMGQNKDDEVPMDD